MKISYSYFHSTAHAGAAILSYAILALTDSMQCLSFGAIHLLPIMCTVIYYDYMLFFTGNQRQTDRNEAGAAD